MWDASGRGQLDIVLCGLVLQCTECTFSKDIGTIDVQAVHRLALFLRQIQFQNDRRAWTFEPADIVSQRIEVGPRPG